VILDCLQSRVIFCRDWLGIKPLYPLKGDGVVAVASEIKWFRPIPGFTARVHSDIAAEYPSWVMRNRDRVSSRMSILWRLAAGSAAHWIR
jgi:asparagine synthetase B (glutamine-hydrolysing)